MVSKKQRDYLKLYQSIMDTGSEVVRMLTESKCRSNHGIDFATYMDSKKHYFYHQWKTKRKKRFCCDCPPVGCNIPNTRNMHNKMFTKWYKFAPSIQVPTGHMDAQHFCICQYTTTNLSIEEFDLSDLKFLLKNTNLLSQVDACQLEIISTVRNSVCHAVSMNKFTANELKDLWSQFETATLQLTEQQNKRMVKMLLERTLILSKNDVDKLMNEISDLNVENNRKVDTVISTINESVRTSTATIANRIQLAEERIQTTTTLAQEQIRTDINANTKEFQNCLNRNVENITQITTEIKEIKEIMKETFAALTALIEINVQKPADTNTNEENQQVKFQIKIESDVLDEDKAQTNLASHIVPYTDEHNSDEDKIKLHSVMKKCILLEASASSNIFRSKDNLRSAIRELIQKVLDAGDVDTSKDSTLKVRLTTPLNDYTAVDTSMVSQPSNMCSQCNELLRLLEEKNDIIRKQETHLTAKDIRIGTLRAENDVLRKHLRVYSKDYISVDTDSTTKSADKYKASAKKRIKRDKDNDADILGKTYSLQSTDMYESVRLKGEPYLINAGAVFVFQTTRFRSHLSAWTNPDSTFLPLDGCSDGKTADFARIAERFSEFQGFKFHEQISYNDVFDIVKETNKRIKTEMDCLVVLIPQIGITSDFKDILEISLSMPGGKPTVIIMQAETNDLKSSFLTKVLTKKDCIVAIFTAKTEVVAKLLGAATEEMKSGDDFANVLRAVSKQVESANVSQSIVFSTLTKELCFQKRKF